MPEQNGITRLQDPTLADVTDVNGKHWTAIQSDRGHWHYLVDIHDKSKKGPYPLPLGDWRMGPRVGAEPEHDPLKVYTIYLNPKDVARPDENDLYVMRLWEIEGGEVRATEEMWTAATLDEIRANVPWTCVCLSREPEDQPHILESWF